MVTSASTIESSSTLAQTTVRSPTLRVEDLRAGADDRVALDDGLATQDDAGLEGHVLGDLARSASM